MLYLAVTAFGGVEVAGVYANDRLIIAYFVDVCAFPTELHTQRGGSFFYELAHGVLHAGGDNEAFCLLLLQHQPLHAHIVFGVAPVTQGINVANKDAVLQAHIDVGQATGDHAGADVRIHVIGLGSGWQQRQFIQCSYRTARWDSIRCS